MFTKLLIRVGLVATAFLVIPGMDVRNVKLDIAGMVAVAIVLAGIYEHGIKPYKNKWLMIFLWVACSSYFIAPRSPIAIFGIDVTLFWVWQPMYYFLVFAILIFVISSIDFTIIDFSKILRWITWCGFVMACYCLLQFLKLDQLFLAHTDATYGHMAGFVGNPTHVAPYIGMIIPICLYMRRKTMAITMIVAVLLISSTVAIVSTLAGIFVFFILQSKKSLQRTIVISILVTIVVCLGYKHLPSGYLADNERFMMWGKVINDLRIPQLEGSPQIFPMTGMGMGTFKYVFHLQHQNAFHQAHNEFVELLYNTGAIGIGLFISAIALFFKKNLHMESIFNIDSRGNYYHARMALIASLVCVMVTACGTFIWQIGTTVFLSALAVGLLTNESLGGKG